MSRYDATFTRLAARDEGMFVPFVVVGDPSPEHSLEIIRSLIKGGADALELGLPFSDPVADGPVIQAADVRALEAGVTMCDVWRILSIVRAEHEEIPIGLLVYANLVEAPGRRVFYHRAADAGVDSMLVADVPMLEARPYFDDAMAAGIDPVFIATPNTGEQHLRDVASMSRGYTYTVTRAGVTGVDGADRSSRAPAALVGRLRELGAAPPVLGFGIGRPEQVRAGLATGAAGVISGSAVVRLIATHIEGGALHALPDSLSRFVEEMKRATTN